MNTKFKKSPEKIKNQIEFWFYNYFNKTVNDFNGYESFTLFEILNKAKKKEIYQKLELNNKEIPVLLLTVSKSEYIINTTERFIRIVKNEKEYINYIDFEWHKGYKSIGIKTNSGKIVSIKSENYVAEFEIQKRNGEISVWNIPTGTAGFGFWNVTKKCELIGRKYL